MGVAAVPTNAQCENATFFGDVEAGVYSVQGDIVLCSVSLSGPTEFIAIGGSITVVSGNTSFGIDGRGDDGDDGTDGANSCAPQQINPQAGENGEPGASLTLRTITSFSTPVGTNLDIVISAKIDLSGGMAGEGGNGYDACCDSGTIYPPKRGATGGSGGNGADCVIISSGDILVGASIIAHGGAGRRGGHGGHTSDLNGELVANAEPAGASGNGGNAGTITIRHAFEAASDAVASLTGLLADGGNTNVYGGVYSGNGANPEPGPNGGTGGAGGDIDIVVNNLSLRFTNISVDGGNGGSGGLGGSARGGQCSDCLPQEDITFAPNKGARGGAGGNGGNGGTIAIRVDNNDVIQMGGGITANGGNGSSGGSSGQNSNKPRNGCDDDITCDDYDFFTGVVGAPGGNGGNAGSVTISLSDVASGSSNIWANGGKGEDASDATDQTHLCPPFCPPGTGSGQGAQGGLGGAGGAGGTINYSCDSGCDLSGNFFVEEVCGGDGGNGGGGGRAFGNPGLGGDGGGQGSVNGTTGTDCIGDRGTDGLVGVAFLCH